MDIAIVRRPEGEGGGLEIRFLELNARTNMGNKNIGNLPVGCNLSGAYCLACVSFPIPLLCWHGLFSFALPPAHYATALKRRIPNAERFEIVRLSDINKTMIPLTDPASATTWCAVCTVIDGGDRAQSS
jgi:hypothetical protein